MSTEVKTAVEEMQKATAELKMTLANDRKFSAETREKLDRIADDIAKWNEVYHKQSKEIEDLQARIRALGERKGNGPDERTKVFWRAMRNPESISQEDRKTLSTISIKQEGLEEKQMTSLNVETGGFLCPPELVTEIIAGVVEYSPVRALAWVRPTAQKSVLLRRMATRPTAYWVGEGVSPTSSAAKFKGEEIHAHALMAEVPVSKEDLQDAFVNLEQVLRDAVAEQFGAAEGAAFVAGAHPARPEGIATNATVFAARCITTGTGNTLALADIDAAVFGNATYTGLASRYADRATWLVNRRMLSKILAFQPGSGAPPVWQPALSAGAPSTIRGIPWRESPDLDVDGAVKKNVLILGDFRSGYMIVDRIPYEVEIDPYTVPRFVKYTFYARVGGAVILPEAFKLVRTPES